MTSSFWQPIQNSTYTLGEKVLINNGVFPHAFWYWLGVAALFGYMILFNTIYTLALTYLNRQYNLTPVTIIRWVPIFLCLFFQSGQFTLLLLFFTKKKKLVLNVCLCGCTALGKPQAVITEEELAQKTANLTGVDSIVVSTRHKSRKSRRSKDSINIYGKFLKNPGTFLSSTEKWKIRWCMENLLSSGGLQIRLTLYPEP